MGRRSTAVLKSRSAARKRPNRIAASRSAQRKIVSSIAQLTKSAKTKPRLTLQKNRDQDNLSPRKTSARSRSPKKGSAVAKLTRARRRSSSAKKRTSSPDDQKDKKPVAELKKAGRDRSPRGTAGDRNREPRSKADAEKHEKGERPAKSDKDDRPRDKARNMVEKEVRKPSEEPAKEPNKLKNAQAAKAEKEAKEAKEAK